MAKRTVADTIREITQNHLLNHNGLLLGQAITAVGWVNNTVPDCQGILELPMTDVAGAGIAVGAALVGRRPIFVIRFQDLLVLNASPLIFYAAKTKELHGKSAPIFIRAIAAEGLGPVHSGVLHSICMHFPGFRVAAPMTPGEYEEVWKEFMADDTPFLVSEHRQSFTNTEELPDVLEEDAAITLYAVSSTRFEVGPAVQRLKAKGISCNVVHICWLKPFLLSPRLLGPLSKTKLGLVIDPGYEIAGASQSLAYDLSQATGYRVKALGLRDKTKCLCPPLQNAAPNAERIYNTAKEMLQR